MPPQYNQHSPLGHGRQTHAQCYQHWLQTCGRPRIWPHHHIVYEFLYADFWLPYAQGWVSTLQNRKKWGRFSKPHR